MPKPISCSDLSLITQVKNNDIVLQRFTYSSNCQLFELIESNRYQKFSYDLTGKLVKIEQAFGSQNDINQFSDLEYDASGKLTSNSTYIITTNNTNTLVYYFTYTYGNNLITKLDIHDSQGNIFQSYNFVYDSHGNVIRDDYYHVNGTDEYLFRTALYEFDDKINPYMVFSNLGFPGVYSNLNNVTKVTETDYDDTGNPSQSIIHNTYEYNARYPVKVNGKDYLYGEEQQ